MKIKIMMAVLLGIFLTACKPNGVSNEAEPDTNSGKGDAANASYQIDQVERYVEYSDTAIAEATANGGKALLFFHASWCPTCRVAENDILSKADQLPDDLTIIKTDYDTYSDLKKQYGVTYQHTFVQVDSEGAMITKWNGGSLDEIIDRVE